MDKRQTSGDNLSGICSVRVPMLVRAGDVDRSGGSGGKSKGGDGDTNIVLNVAQKIAQNNCLDVVTNENDRISIINETYEMMSSDDYIKSLCQTLKWIAPDLPSHDQSKSVVFIERENNVINTWTGN